MTTPQSVDAEKALLCSLMGNMKLVDEHADALKSSLFFDARHRVLFDAIMHLWKEGKDCDIITLTDALTSSGSIENIGGAGYVSEVFTFLPTWQNAGEYLDILKKKHTARLAISVAKKIIATAEDPVTSDDLGETVQKALVSVAADSETTSRIESVGEAAMKRLGTYEEIFKNKGKIMGLTTGLKPLDELTGGLKAGQLIVIGAPTKGGKTALALNIALRTATAGNGVGVFSLEMSSGELIDRLVASSSGVDLSILSREPTSQDLKKITFGVNQVSSLPIWIRDESQINPLQLRAAARRMVATHNVKLIVVDYIQLIEPTDRKEGRERQVAEVSRTLKQLAKELGVTIIALTQLNADGASRESRAIEHDCDSFWVIRHDEEKRKWALDIRLARSHSRGSIPLEFRSQYLRFDEGQ